MTALKLTNHAELRLAQRGIQINDAELIAMIGTEVESGYLVLTKDYQQIERAFYAFLNRCRRVVGKRLLVADGRVITAYHPIERRQRRLLRTAYARDLC